MPTKLKEPVGQVLSDVNQQLSNYVRGQVTVAIIVAVMFMIFFKIIGLRYAVTLGVTAGILNLVPYLGSFSHVSCLSIGLDCWASHAFESSDCLYRRTNY